MNLADIRVLHIITRLANGGAEETVFDLLLELAKQGIYCHLAIGREIAPEVLEKYTLPPQCKIHTINHLVRNPHPLYEILAEKEIRSLIRTYKYNLVQTHGSKAGILGRVAAYKERVPAIVGMIHGISFPPAMSMAPRLLYKYLERYAAKRTHALVCVGEDMKQKYIAAKVGKAEQYSVIYTGMHLENFSKISLLSKAERQELRKKYELPEDMDTVVLGSVGRLEDRKNQKALIAMMPKLLANNDKVHLCLIGDGPNYDDLSTMVSNMGLDGHVSFTGYVGDVWNVLGAIDIHCMVSLWEGLPRVLVQTSASGLPNVCYEVDGAWEIIKDNKSGYIVQHGNENSFIETIQSLITQPDLRKQFGEQASLLADHRWSLHAFGTDTVALYSKLLS